MCANVMKLNYTSLQHAVAPVEDERLEPARCERPVAVLALHGQLAAVAWAFAQAVPGGRLGYVQTEGGALPGGHSRTVRALRERGLLAGHLTAGAAFGGERARRSRPPVRCTTGCAHSAGTRRYADRGRGSSAPARRSGMAACRRSTPRMRPSRSAARRCWWRGCPRAISRARHRGISHHTLTVLDLLLEPVTVALPAGMRSPVGADLRAGLGAVFGGAMPSRPVLELDVERPARITRHDWRRAVVDLPAYAASAICPPRRWAAV